MGTRFPPCRDCCDRSVVEGVMQADGPVWRNSVIAEHPNAAAQMALRAGCANMDVRVAARWSCPVKLPIGAPLQTACAHRRRALFSVHHRATTRCKPHSTLKGSIWGRFYEQLICESPLGGGRVRGLGGVGEHRCAAIPCGDRVGACLWRCIRLGSWGRRACRRSLSASRTTSIQDCSTAGSSGEQRPGPRASESARVAVADAGGSGHCRRAQHHPSRGRRICVRPKSSAARCGGCHRQQRMLD